MNRRPTRSRRDFDSFSAEELRSFSASSPDTRFFEEKERLSPLKKFLLVLIGVIGLTLLGNLLVNQFVFIHEETVPVTGLIEAFDGYTILHISDLKGERYGTQQRLIRAALNNKHFDLVLITGDMLSEKGNAEPFYELLDVLKSLEPDAPIFFIAGDEDPVPLSMEYASAGSPFASWILGAGQRGAFYLSSPQIIERETQRLCVLSLTSATLDTAQLQPQYEQRLVSARGSGDENAIELAKYQLQSLMDITAFRSKLRSNDITLVLTHVPNTSVQTITAIPPETTLPITLLFYGHTLGGMTRLPFAGPIFLPSDTAPRYGLFPGPSSTALISRVGQTWVSASSGLGKQDSAYPGFFIRLFNPPTMTLLTLSSTRL